MPPTVDVVVVGAGMGGLTAARALQASGRSVAVLEARDRIGGRLRSIPVGDAGIDLGATWFWGNEPRILALVEELRLAVHPQHLEGDALYQVPGAVHRLAGNPIDGPAGRISSGMQSVADALAAALDPGSVRLGHVVRRVRHVGTTMHVEGEFGAFEAESVILAIPPVLAVHTIEFEPGLPEETRRVADSTPVWMGAMTKVVVRYDRPFWRERGLAGAVMSHVGPMREIHDMSGPGGDPAALFGFAPPRVPGAPACTHEDVLAQLVQLFGAEAPQPTEVTLFDWRDEEFTIPRGADALQDYGTYGHAVFQAPAMGGRLHWASTETAREAPGHIEGALSAGARAARAVHSHLEASELPDGA